MALVLATSEGVPQPPSRSLSAARARKLHVGHFAFMRALVQGVDAKAAWERYLRTEGQARDMRLVSATIAWIRTEFAAAARREDRFGTARLVRLQLKRIPESTPPAPTLAQFAEEAGLEDDSEADQLEAFNARYAVAGKRLARAGKLVSRQLDALAWLEGLIAQAPSAGDPVVAWLNPALAARLEAVGLFTLAQLVDRVNGIGRLWYGSIPAFGVAKARLVVAWLKEHAQEIGLKVGAHVGRARTHLMKTELASVVAPASDIRPLEKLVVPPELDGTHGAYRRPQSQCLLKSTNDYQAILAWLRSKHGLTPEQEAAQRAGRRHRDIGIELRLDWLDALSNTQRAYRKEAERFLLWAIVERGRALSSMTNEDCVAYRDFLCNPAPTGRWCGPRARERWSPLWRPFEGPLSPAAQRQAITILKNLYGFLVDQNYLMGNPWSAVTIPRGGAPRLHAGRSLSRAQWGFAQQQLALRGETSAEERLRFALALLYATGLRLSELVAARVDHLARVDYGSAPGDSEPLQGWVLRVLGKGQREREVPVPLAVVAKLARYLQHRGLDPDPECIGNIGAHLLGHSTDALERAPALLAGRSTDVYAGVAASTFYRQIKEFFADCAAALERLGRWERGRALPGGQHPLAAPHPCESRDRIGHADRSRPAKPRPRITRDDDAYVTTEAKRRLRAVETFWGEGGSVE